jgi:hypothetical protein
MCCKPIVVFSDGEMTLQCGKCGKAFVRSLPENGNHHIVNRLVSDFEEHTLAIHDCSFNFSLLGNEPD